MHSMDAEITVACGKGKHSLEICGTVGLHELLLGSQEDVGFKPEHREAEFTLGSSEQSLTANTVTCVCKSTVKLTFSALT